ncbi:hypothetical protein CDAR_302602 [Caerostris darwini]|uniref:Structure-specific endonuclease subunit SLX4 n=1 Tax=Caerostris darwini TaxID=1538125 RepID=A0AAV4V443_9ARAC|nr:hypothetical protein CDAR_302602 [Caerostris darwini]
MHPSDINGLCQKNINICNEKQIDVASQDNISCSQIITQSTSQVSVDKSPLDESLDDFQESQIEKKLKLKKKHEKEILTCIVCQKDLTQFNLNERSVHVNQCIDGQSSASEQGNSANTFILECPLCFKNFSTPELRCIHIKKCGKSRGLGTQSVIQALQLQERHVLERRALGLPLNIKPPKQPKKPTAKKFVVKPKSAMESDIQLAKALSLSLKQNENQTHSNVLQTDNGDIKPIACLQIPLEFQNPGKAVSKKAKLRSTPFLLLRTEEERQKIIMEKVNAIIASTSKAKTEEVNQDASQQKAAFLWDLSGKAEDKSTYYVEQLLDWICPSDFEVGSKLCNLSQIAGHRIFTQLPCDYTFNDADKSSENSTLPNNSQSPSLISSLQSLIGNSWMSDIDIHTASGIVIPAHKLLLALRCPVFKKTFDESTTFEKHIIHWENISFDAALHFLNFIYTGSTEWKEDIIDELYQLAKKYEVHDLLNILNSSSETLEMLTLEDVNENEANNSIREINEVAMSTEEQEHKFVENTDVTTENADVKQSQSTNNGYFADKNLSIQNNHLISPNLNDVISITDLICIPKLNTTKELNIAENIQPVTKFEDNDIFILEENNVSCNKNNYVFEMNSEICNADSNSSNDSCKILKTNKSSDLQTSFDTFNETNKIVSPNAFHTPKKNMLGRSSPRKLHEHVVSPSSCRNHLALHTVSKITPKRILNECISSNTSHFAKANIYQNNMYSPTNSTKSFSESSRSSEKKCVYLPNSKNETIIKNSNEVVFDNEEITSHHASILFKDLEDKCKVRVLSPRKISPCKASKLQSPSFYDYNCCNTPKCSSRNTFFNNKNANQNETEINFHKSPYQKNQPASPDVPTSYNKEFKIGSNIYASEKDLKEMHHYNTSMKRNLETSLSTINNNVYEMNVMSSPEILVCDSDDDLETVNNNCSSKNLKNIYTEEFNSNIDEAVDYFKRNSVPESNDLLNSFKNSSNCNISVKERVDLPIVIDCNSDSDLNEDETAHLTLSEKNYLKNHYKSNKLDFTQCEKITKEPTFTPVKTDIKFIENKIKNNFVDLVDCSSNSSDNIYITQKLQSVNVEKEIIIEDDVFINDECMDDRPLWERIQGPKHTIPSKTFEGVVLSSPDTPWTFQTNKHPQDLKNVEKSPKSLKNSVCSELATPKDFLKRKTSKDSNDEDKPKKSTTLSSSNDFHSKFKISDSPITPLPDYKNMVTPQLKEALRKVGVRALPRKKAVAVLSHIYDETHPWNSKDSEEKNSEMPMQFSQKCSNIKKNLSVPKKRKKIDEISTQPSKRPKEINTCAQRQIPKPSTPSTVEECTIPMHFPKDKICSPDSSPTKSSNSREENGYNFEMSSDFSDSSQPESKEKSGQIREYILSNDDLYKRVLTYTPLNLAEFQHELKENGISVGVQKLMDYLDEQCITFTMPRKEEYRKKQQVRTQRFRKRMIAKISQQKD